MNEDEVRALLKAAHVDDGAPTFASTLARRPKRRAPLFAIPAAAFAIAAGALLFVARAPTSHETMDAGVVAPSVASSIAFDAPELRVTTLRTPTDSLLDVPGATFLSSTPRLQQGVTP